MSSIGFAETRNSLLSQAEVDELVNKFEKRAMILAAEYVEIDATASPLATVFRLSLFDGPG